MFKAKHMVMAILAGMSSSLMAGKWELMPIKGHEPNKWEPAPNWVWHKKNPLVLDDATWEIAYKKGGDSEITGKYRSMTQGKAWNYNFAWRDHSGKADPLSYYMEKSLTAASFKGAGKGNPSAIFFKPATPGKFKVDISGKIKIQNKTAGYGIVSIGIMTEDRTKINVLKDFNLNLEDGFGKYPSEFTFSENVELPEGAELVFIIQAVNPGPASSGKAKVLIDKFSIASL
jgi:hypothetical protein